MNMHERISVKFYPHLSAIPTAISIATKGKLRKFFLGRHYVEKKKILGESYVKVS